MKQQRMIDNEMALTELRQAGQHTTTRKLADQSGISQTTIRRMLSVQNTRDFKITTLLKLRHWAYHHKNQEYMAIQLPIVAQRDKLVHELTTQSETKDQEIDRLRKECHNLRVALFDALRASLS